MPGGRRGARRGLRTRRRGPNSSQNLRPRRKSTGSSRASRAGGSTRSGPRSTAAAMARCFRSALTAPGGSRRPRWLRSSRATRRSASPGQVLPDATITWSCRPRRSRRWRRPTAPLRTGYGCWALTTPASLGALPVLTLPVPLPSGMSTGLQVVVNHPQSPVLSWVAGQLPSVVGLIQEDKGEAHEGEEPEGRVLPVPNLGLPHEEPFPAHGHEGEVPLDQPRRQADRGETLGLLPFGGRSLPGLPQP